MRPSSRLGFRVVAVALVAAAVGLTVFTVVDAGRSGSELPGRFVQATVFDNLRLPTALAFSPDGRVFVAQQDGRILVFDGLADRTPTLFADLRREVFNNSDRGLLGLALDPRFPARPFVYVSYTYDGAIGGTAPRWGTHTLTFDVCPNPPGLLVDGCVVSGRLSRLRAQGNHAVHEQVLIEDWCQQANTHSVGDISFGPDGMLYMSAGDGANGVTADWGQHGIPRNPCGDPPAGVGGQMTPPTAEGGALRAQDLRTPGDPVTLDGTVIRVDPETGAAPPDNPLADSRDENARRIIAYGLKQPFRFAWRPGARELWIGDVGVNTWEEIDRLTSTAAPVENYGYPCYEGAEREHDYQADGVQISTFDICRDLYANQGRAVTDPYYAYSHYRRVDTCAAGGSAISALRFYDGSSYPQVYRGALFFADYSRACIWVMVAGSDGLPDPTSVSTFARATAVDLELGPGGDLYYVDPEGSVNRIRYRASG